MTTPSTDTAATTASTTGTTAPATTGTAATATATATAATLRRWRVVFWATAIATALPFAFVRHPPFTDLPEHVAAMATIARLLPGGGGAPYAIGFGTSQYLLYHAAGGVLARVFGDAVIANRALLAAVAVLFPVSLRALLRALGRDERLAIFGAMVFWNRALVIGFLPFVASIPIALFTLAAVVRQLDAPSRRRAFGLGALAIVLFYTHLSAFVLVVVSALVMTAIRAARARARAERTAIALARAVAAPLAPSLVAAALWWRAGSLADGTGQIEHVRRIPLASLVEAMPVWTFEIWQSHVDELAAVVWWAAFLALVAFALRDPPRPPGTALFALVPFACSAAVYFATPFGVGAAAYLNVRLAPLLVLFALVGLRPRPGLAGSVPLGAAALAAIVMAGDATFEMRRVEREHLGDLDALLAHARPGGRLAMLDFQARSPRTHFWPYPFAGSYYRARGGDVAGYSFTEMPHWSVHYAAGAAPPQRAPFWIYGPCAYRYRGDGAYYDYVLVQGPVDPFADAPIGPTFAAIAREGAFTLFAKTAPEAAELAAEPDRGPCKPRPPRPPPDAR